MRVSFIMRCEEIRERLFESEGPSGVIADDGVLRHLAQCPSCAKEHQALVATWSMLEAWAAPAPAPAFTARVMARVHAEATCAPVRDALIEANGVVDASTRGHVEGCAACANAAAGLRATWGLLASWPDLEPTPALVRGVSARVASSPRLLATPPVPRFLRAWGTIAAVLAILLGTTAVVQTRHDQTGSAVAIVATTAPSPAHVAALQAPPDVFNEGDDILDDIKEPAPNRKTDEIIEELLTASFRTAVR